MHLAPPQIVPRAQLATHVADLLFFLYDGPNLPLAQQPMARQGIQAFADSSPNRDAVAQQAQAQGINLALIAGRAPQVANMMDVFFGAYNVAWNGNDAYGFDNDPPGRAQATAWGIVPEDINSTRHYCVLQTNQIEQMLSNLLNLLKRLNRPL
jgi:hypothetical protein